MNVQNEQPKTDVKAKGFTIIDPWITFGNQTMAMHKMAIFWIAVNPPLTYPTYVYV